MMFCAHINPITSGKQSVKEHLENVSHLSMEYGAKISLEATCKLIGILHDMGKETKKFDAYIKYSAEHPQDKSLRGTINHSTAGAKYIYDTFYKSNDPYEQLTAQLMAVAICSHHGGLIDCLDVSGKDIFTSKMMTDKEIFYDEALRNYTLECLDTAQIRELFYKAKTEIQEALIHIRQIDNRAEFGQFAMGLLEKYMFSCVVDADRYDTYSFMAGREPSPAINRTILWQELSDKLESALEAYPKKTQIDLLRADISLTCKNFAVHKPGIYQLSVPTGGGKTLSSLRYALEHAQIFHKDRIFYIIPFTTIIDQNAREIKNILCRDDVILEHHSNLIMDNENEDYKLLTERWDSPIILTTMVQFLDTLFSGGTQNIRRMHNFANSIFIFDEIQAIPIKCINMFNSAINFLAEICHATIILCTATQPILSSPKIHMPLKLSENPDMISDMYGRLGGFKRVELVDKRIIGGYSPAALQEFVLDIMEHVESVLVVFNTKNAAKEVFNELQRENTQLPKEQQYLIFHLSTNMCSSHRMKILEEMRAKLRKQRMICVSTQLIEAGVNISFGCVVRSLAGLDSIAQAAGRCNRHGERPCSNVYIVNVQGENISKLVDIKEGQECTKRVLDEFRENPAVFDQDLLSQKAMDRYYEYYFYNRLKAMNYTLPKINSDATMYDLLAGNKKVSEIFCSRNGYKPKLLLKQSFKTAGNNFQVINQNTTGVIVPYGEGKELIAKINGDCDLKELKQYLKKAQHFSVNLFETDKRKLDERQGIAELNHGGVLALKEGFYRDDLGVTVEGVPMEFLIS
jgi:CRISPR-associated endonuclease/helicase Cas3